MLLDEATSALDSASEAVVQQALDELTSGGSLRTTTITIAHRLSTIRRMDQIVCVIRGRVAEQGTHSYLLARRGVYHDLVRAQETS